MFAAWKRWIGETLERRIAVYSVMAIVGVCLIFGSVSFLASLTLLHTHARSDQTDRIERIVGRLNHHLDTLVKQTQNLSENPLVFSALLDSQGRDVYLQPFFSNFRLSVPGGHGLALCDFEGKPLAYSESLSPGCFTGSQDAFAVVDSERPQTALIHVNRSDYAVLFQPVLYPGTRRAEGYLVATLDLWSLLDEESLLFTSGVLLLHAFDGETLYSAQAGQRSLETPVDRAIERPLFAGGLFTELGLTLALHEPLNLLEGSRYLLSGYGAGTLILILLAWWISRRTASSLAAPLIALNASARHIAEEGPGVARDGLMMERADEIGQLASAFNDMVAALGRKQEQLGYLAYHDSLTGLPNRLLLSDRISQALARVERGEVIALCYIDLDDFKPINDQHGHEIGDRLLIEVARRLAAAARAQDTLSRLGGDEFVLLLTDVQSVAYCERILHRLMMTLKAPFELDEEVTAQISASIGVVVHASGEMPEPPDADLLLRMADQAMYEAKRAGRDQICFFGGRCVAA